MRALAMMLPGNQEVRAKGLHTLPMRSWIMNRPTRVPASTVVSMNRASNIMAKWYQNACRAAPKMPVTPAKIADIPTASVGAPPVRPTMESSPTALAVLWSVWGLTEYPKPLTAWEADWTVSPRSAGLAFIAKYTPGSRVTAAIIAITATKDSVSIAPYPMNCTCDSFWISLGVVPEATSEWKPDRAPQAMVIKTNGNRAPAKTGPWPLNANSVNWGICIGGRVMAMPTARRAMVPIFMNVER